MPPEDPVTRSECLEKEKMVNGSISRLHGRVDVIEKSAAAIETSAKMIENCVCKMEKIIYGNENADGIITKVSNLNQKVSGVYWLGGVVIIAFIGSMVAMVFKK